MPKPQELDRLRVIAEIARVANDVREAYLQIVLVGHDRDQDSAVQREHATQTVADALANPKATAGELWDAYRDRVKELNPIPKWDDTFPITRTAHLLFVATIRSLYPQ